MAGDLKITASTQQAQQNIQNLQTRVERLQGAITGLGSVLTTVFSAAVINRAIQYADALQDISTATGISIARVTGLTTAFIENGGSAEGAQKAILELSKSIDEAAQGSGRVQRAFEDVGVTLRDLETLSEQDILARTIQGLSRITDNTRRLALANQLLGKESRLVDFAGVAGNFDAASAAAARYQSSIQEAARLQGQLDRAFITLQNSILKSLEPLARFVNNLKPEQIDAFVEAVVKIGGAAASIAVLASAISSLSKIVAGIGLATAGWYAMFTQGGAQALKTVFNLDTRVKGLIKGLAAATTVAGKFEEVIKFIRIAGDKTIPFFLGGLYKMLPYVTAVTGAFYAMHEIVKLVFGIDAIDSFLTGLRGIAQALGLIKPLDTGDPDGSFARVEAARNRNLELASREAAKQREIQTAVDALRLRLTDVTTEYQRGGKALVDNLNFETSLVGKTEQQVAVERAVREERERSRRALDDLNRQQTELDQKLKSGAMTQEEYRRSTAEVARAAATIRDMSKQQETAIENATNRLQDKLRLQRIEQLQLQAIFDLEEQRAQTAREMAEYQDRVTAATVQAQQVARELVKENKLTTDRLDLENKIRFLRKQDQDTARTIFDLEQLRKNKLDEIARIQDLPYEERVKQEQAINQEIDAQVARVNVRAEAYRQEQSSFVTGWQQAFEQFRNNVQTEAELAGSVFDKFTQGLEDAFVNFAKTGKLSFKDLMRSIVEMILRSQIQRLIAQIFGGSSAGGNLFTSFLTSLFGGGRAAGGPVASNRAYVVGERGPELFMPRTPGTIIPNGATMGGTTQVTYNINAVDASSFRNLVASDPEFIFAVTEQGRRRQPTTRR